MLLRLKSTTNVNPFNQLKKIYFSKGFANLVEDAFLH